MKVPRNKSSI